MASGQTCIFCQSTSFEIIAGNFFCTQCLTQNDDIQENVREAKVDTTIRTRGVGNKRTDKELQDKLVEIDGWTSWELYNFILHGITNEAIEFGAPPAIKLTVLQLWATYLGKIEVAFTSTKKKCIPKLARNFRKRDADILYGKIKQRKKRKRRRGSTTSASSMISSFQNTGSVSSASKKTLKQKVVRELNGGSTANDSLSSFSGSQSMVSLQSSFSQGSSTRVKIKFNKAAKQEAKKVKIMSKKIRYPNRGRYQRHHVTTTYKLGPQVITPMKLWVILYFALRFHGSNIHLSDMLRYGREGHLSYYKLDHLLPPEVSMSKRDVNMLSQTNELTHKGFRRAAASFAKFLKVELDQPDFLPLIEHYCQDLQLPRGILLYTERLIALSPPKMIFNEKNPCTPNYEGRAMAFIVVVLKVLFGLDGITEFEISRVAEKINRKIIKNIINNYTNMIPGCITPSIIIHGGVGESSDSVMVEKMVTCQKAASVGYKILMKGGKASDAAEAALSWFEDDEFFNCGYGSVLNEIGEVQMDASMMDGTKFEIGSVAAVSDIEHPTSLAKYIMEKYPNTIIVGDGARKLAKCAGLNLTSKGNMIAPASYWAYKTADSGDFEDFTFDTCGVGEAIKNTVGCVVWDGYSIVAAASTGGLNKKLVGRVGDSPLLGCGVFANDRLGCCLTGHGESAIKLGLTRAIANCVLKGHSLSEALQINLDDMQKQTGYDGGGIALEKCGCWSVYITGTRMPYAFIRNNWITYGIDKGEKRTKQEASERGVLLSRLFSFREWQRFIECRRSILSDVHFPTKLRYDPESPGNTHLYLRFLGLMHSKKEGEPPRVTDYKHALPEILSREFRTCFEKLNENILPINEITIFPPSLTPQHSYIQYLLNDPFNDLPEILRVNFFETKVGYTTKPELLQELAGQCHIELKVVDTNLHFIEKKVSEFEQSKMPSVQSLNEMVIVNDSGGDANISAKSENLFDYIHRKTESKVTVNRTKKKYYDNVKADTSEGPEITYMDEFLFDQVSENGKLLIPVEIDSEDEELVASVSKVDLEPCDKDSILKEQFRKAYNLNLSEHEQKATLRSEAVLSKRRYIKRIFGRNAQGRFVIKSKETSDNEIKKEKMDSEEESILNSEVENVDGNIYKNPLNDLHDSNPFDLHESDISILQDFNESRKSITLDHCAVFRPFKDYWIYNCIFSRVKPKNFQLFEKELPVSFRWLLRECADMIEMSTEDLYEEICLVEAYYSHILKPQDEKNKSKNSIDKKYRNSIFNKW